MLTWCCARNVPTAPDDAGDVAVVQDQDVPLRHRLEEEIVEAHQARRCRAPNTAPSITRGLVAAL